MAVVNTNFIAQDKTHIQWMADPAILGKGQLIFTVDGHIRQGDGTRAYADCPQIAPIELPNPDLIAKGKLVFTADSQATVRVQAGVLAEVTYISAGQWHVELSDAQPTKDYALVYGYEPGDFDAYDREPHTMTGTQGTTGFNIGLRDVTSDGFYDGGVITVVLF